MENFRDKFQPTPIIRLIVQFDKMSVYTDSSVFEDYVNDNKFSIYDFQNEFNKQTENVVFGDDEERMNFENYCEQESDKYFESYPKLFRNSFFVTLYSYFESKLKKLRADLTKYDKKNSIVDIKQNKRESLINWHKRFFEFNYKLDLSNIAENWDRIQKFGKIRNAITHNNSNFKSDIKNIDPIKFMEILRSFDSITFDEQTGDFFIENENFILEFLKIIDRCLIDIYSQIEQKI